VKKKGGLPEQFYNNDFFLKTSQNDFTNDLPLNLYKNAIDVY